MDSMIPLCTSVAPQRVPWVNYALIGTNVACFAYELMLGPQVVEFVQVYGWVPANFFHALQQGTTPILTPLFLCMFLHGGWMHLIGNLLYLYIFGGHIEDRLGHGRYFVFYCIGGALAILIQTYTTPSLPLPMIGASGAVAAVTGAYFVFYPTSRVLTLIPLIFSFPVVRVPTVCFLLFWLLLQVAAGLSTTATTPESQMVPAAWGAHIGGVVVGSLLGPLFLLRRHPRRRRSQSSLVFDMPRSAWR
jgi:membrane associated rhomboid family serine protease